MEYYHSLITQKSWEELILLKEKIGFVLIGGWAIYLYAKSLKSKDIDIIVDFDQLPILEKHYQLSKNERLQKYEARKDEIEIDIYLPHYSQLGIPVEDLQKQTENIEGFQVLSSAYLLALKIFTLSERGRSPKGRKDFLDIISLIIAQKDILLKTRDIIKQYAIQEQLKTFLEFLKENSQLAELNLSSHHFAKLKKEILEVFN